jgi:2-polyprenyl-3-methyl-5-hydroxy-6-metoxy-1,4-benzoquinol methylase
MCDSGAHSAPLQQMKRSFDPAVLEMMDRPQPLSAELERDLQRIRQLNRWFGSYRLVLAFIRRWIKSAPADSSCGEPTARTRIVDLATGSGDIPRLIADYARKVGAHVEIDALDRQPATLEVAAKLSTGYPEISYREADVLAWNSTQTYDIALCTLALHHFSDEDAVTVLRRCRELSRGFILVSDLRRGFLLQAGVHVLTALIFREPMTRHDARLSAIRAFSFAEMRDLALRAGWKHFGHKKFRFARQAIWLENV